MTKSGSMEYMKDYMGNVAGNSALAEMMRSVIGIGVDANGGGTAGLDDTGTAADTNAVIDTGAATDDNAVADNGPTADDNAVDNSVADGRVELPTPGTPRYYNTHRTKTPFWRQHRSADGEPAWIKAGRGLLAVGDGTPARMVAPGLVFSIEPDENGTNRIARYGRTDHKDDAGLGRPYAWLTMRTAISDGKYARRDWISYEDMIIAIRRVFPTAWVPTEAEFYAEYGIKR